MVIGTRVRTNFYRKNMPHFSRFMAKNDLMAFLWPIFSELNFINLERNYEFFLFSRNNATYGQLNVTFGCSICILWLTSCESSSAVLSSGWLICNVSGLFTGVPFSALEDLEFQWICSSGRIHDSWSDHDCSCESSFRFLMILRPVRYVRSKHKIRFQFQTLIPLSIYFFSQ